MVAEFKCGHGHVCRFFCACIGILRLQLAWITKPVRSIGY